MSQIPYWLTINSMSQDDLADSQYFSFFNTNSVNNGDSPLHEHGRVFVNVLYSRGFSTHDKIWLFPKSSLDNKQSHQVGTLFNLLIRIKGDIALTRHGTITIDDVGELVDWQPPLPENQERVYTLRQLLPKEADSTFCLAKAIAEESQFYKYFNQLSYLKELRCTDPYLGYLGLWSFIEIEWADNPKKTDMKKSLKALLEIVFRGQRESKRAFDKRLNEISAKVGQSVDEYSIRNLLAHGKYHKVSTEWDVKSNQEFHGVHDELFRIMLEGLEVKIRNGL